MYIVVSRTLVGPSRGVLTWTGFPSKEYFDKWNDAKMRSWYETVEEGVTEERALELCSSPEADGARFCYALRQVGEALRQI